jgi:protease IV
VAMKKHPVILGILLLIGMGFVFFLFVYGLSSITTQRHSFSSGDKVGIIAVEGVIGDSREAIEQLEEFDGDDTIRAVVLRIDSPGGGVAPSQEIYDALMNFKKKKKVVVSMGSVAASGGYLIACAADRIVANPGTLTGSISAVMYFANAEQLLKKIGLKSSVIKSGKYKDIGSPVRDMTADERVLLQTLVDDIYEQFLKVIVDNRKISEEDLKKIADGRVFTGRQALKLGLVDALGNREYAVRLAGKLSGIKGKPDVVYPRKKGPSLWEFVLQGMSSALRAELKRNVDTGSGGASYLYQ